MENGEQRREIELSTKHDMVVVALKNELKSLGQVRRMVSEQIVKYVDFLMSVLFLLTSAILPRYQNQ